MLDTVLLESPPIGEEQAAQVQARLKTRQGIDNATGEVEYSFVSGSLEGSWDSSVAVNVKRQRWVSVRDWRRVRGRVLTRLEDCPPYLTLEGSVHKALLGHNVHGGPLEPLPAVRWFVADVSRRLGVELPPADAWTVARVDWAEVFDLGSLAGVQEFLRGMGLAKYPRRKPSIYPGESCNFPGYYSTSKAYGKGAEFSKHDFPRLSRCIVEPEQTEEEEGDDWRRVKVVRPARYYDASALQALANNYLRFEVSIKGRKLKADFGEHPHVVKVTRDYLQGVHDEEAARIVREGKSDMETVRKNREVNARLHEVYGSRLANTLFGTWMQFAALGEDEVRARMARRTFYRQRGQLEAAGVSWVASDVYIVEGRSAIPAGFSLVRSDPRRLTAEAPEVAAALAPYSLMA